MNWKLICHLLLAILCVGLCGCGTIPSYEDVGSGYVEATYTRTSWEPEATRYELRYKKGWRTIVVWPKTYGIIVTNGVAVFEAYTAHKPPLSDEPSATMSRVFAVQAPDLPLDITDEILWRWSKESGGRFYDIKTVASSVPPEKTDNGVEFQFAVRTGKDIIVDMNWNQISDIMRDVKENGVVRKDRVWGTSYIEKEFEAEVHK